MKSVVSKFICLSLAAVSMTAHASGCDRSPRTVEYREMPVTVYISKDQTAEVGFPEEYLEGALPERPSGLIWNRTRIDNKLTFSTDSEIYHGLFTVHGGSGRTYVLNILARNDCSDSVVRLVEPKPDEPAEEKPKSSGKPPKSLIEYLITGELPPRNYQRVSYMDKEPSDRLVMEQGSVKFYLVEQFIGPRLIGTTLEVVNTGRSAFRVAIESMDYSAPNIREAFGRVAEITMVPFSRRLGPAPEYISEIYEQSHRGLIHIVSYKGQ